MNLDHEEDGQAFAIPDLYGPSKWLENFQDPASLLFSSFKLNDIDRDPPDAAGLAQDVEAFFRIPDFSLSLGDSGNTPIPLPAVLDSPEPLSVPEEDIDIWLLPEEEPPKVANYQSWDKFDHVESDDHCTPYITEAGSSIFDTALHGDRGYLGVRNINDVVVDPKVYASSILALGLGRNSVLFTWDGDKQQFLPTLPEMRLSGYTIESLDGLSGVFKDCGAITRSLHRFVEKSYSSTKSPARIALADVVSSLLSTIQERLSETGSECKSILELQVIFEPVHSILTCFQRIVLHTSNTRSDESMLSTVFEEIQLQEHRTDSLRDVLIELLSRVSRPWLEFAGEWLGIRRESGLPMTKEGSTKSFVNVTDKEWIDDQGMEMQERDYVLDYDRIPSFIAPEDARAMFEVGKSLRFLRVHHTEHPLANANTIASAQPPALEWKFSWQEIVAVESKALKYEKDLTSAILQFTSESNHSQLMVNHTSSSNGKFELDFFGKPQEDMQAHILASIDNFNLPLNRHVAHDRLPIILDAYLTPSTQSTIEKESIFSPPISLTPLLSFNPLIAAQARIVNGTCMRMFFNSHKLRQHLSLQRSFHLLGNGVFSSMLSHALFDPDLESAERQQGVARSGGVMGLRLGGRETWPPASSELRLALMGVLTESYTSNQSVDKSRTAVYTEKSLPGDLSFGVRDMSEAEIERCMNADSLAALDFLRLTYKPPPPLEAVITPMILYKYDQLFKLLLRVIRMLYVVSAMFRNATDRTSMWKDVDPASDRFRIEAHHFITSVSGYFFDTGIDATWRIFDRKLDEIEARINTDQDNISLGQNEGLDKLREYHERVLDRIMFALLLRKRQQPVMQLLEEIFTIVLQFSKHSREKALGIVGKVEDELDVRELYTKFKKKVGVFISVCRGLSEKKGYGERRTIERSVGQGDLFDGDDLAEENTIDHLLVRLDMSDYYLKTIGV